jgi:acyl-CoA reductase-like NAD-dependent aldehyde dehydrogenase
VAGGYAYSGQVCISLQRIYVHEKIYDQFKNVYVEKVKEVKTGDPALQDTVVGPLITEEEVKRVGDWVLEAADMGGKILAGGTRKGNIYMPTVLDDVPKHARCVKDEIFGPVTALFPYSDFDEAIDKVNDSVYGLQAGVFSRDMGKALKAFNRIEAGGVMINEVPTFRADNFPYGGIKNSGFGREGVKYAVEEMTEIKIMVVDNVM